jgi:hypothetical protein
VLHMKEMRLTIGLAGTAMRANACVCVHRLKGQLFLAVTFS